jgi:hypothetical protein
MSSKKRRATAGCSLGPLTEGSTQAVTIKVTHAGVREVEVWSFDLDGHPKR